MEGGTVPPDEEGKKVNANGTSYTMNIAAQMVARNPGHTVHWYGNRGCQWKRAYAAFERAERNGMIRSEPNPAQKRSTIYFPA